MVWFSFFAAMTGVMGLLALGENGLSGGALIAANVGSLGADPGVDPIFRIDSPLDRQRWTGIVVHHLGKPAGDAESVHRQHLSYGYQGLGYHFLIGNGNGLGDGIIQVGYRWNEQRPGAHVGKTVSGHEDHNKHMIGICLIGNGDRRPFTEEQMNSLLLLVTRLQKELGILKDDVHLYSGMAPEESSPGRFFASTRFEDQLID